MFPNGVTAGASKILGNVTSTDSQTRYLGPAFGGSGLDIEYRAPEGSKVGKEVSK